MSSEELTAIEVVVIIVVVVVKVAIVFCVCSRRYKSSGGGAVNPDTQFLTLTMNNFLKFMEREKPIRFTDQQLRIATDNYSNLLGSGGFGTVYKGIFSNGTMVAVKVLRGNSDKRIDQQFMAEVGTIAVLLWIMIVLVFSCYRRFQTDGSSPKSQILTLKMDKFLNDMEREKPMRFASEQLRIYSNKLLL